MFLNVRDAVIFVSVFIISVFTELIRQFNQTIQLLVCIDLSLGLPIYVTNLIDGCV